MTTSCDYDKSFATSSHRQTSRALTSRAAGGDRRASLMAGTCTVSNYQRMFRWHGKGWLWTGRGEKRGGEWSAAADTPENTHSLFHFV